MSHEDARKDPPDRLRLAAAERRQGRGQGPALAEARRGPGSTSSREERVVSTKVKLVRYVSPFGSPAWMSREEAERHLAEDDARWCEWQELGILSEHHIEIGPPRIEGTEC